ncbi:hypothetical protein SAMN03159341_105321 [Paenibacillus sp. 1_12]|uniref:hypothetical protein n=1 Tax=Paenibacillus sp. 1_12 TaxID=1566278 RepID=UPI0008F006AF|nr:hypothetical protein [Paenibacillus sp. 1_12]SFL37123.1 hypothetical protein SAMN03159341_105321 [Paenibacillus sp. 1_12]
MPQWTHPEQYTAFDNEDQALAFCKDWGLLPQKAAKSKTFRYKGQNLDLPCEIVGYADLVFAVIQVDGQLHNIHPSYLREMQNAHFGKIKLEEDSEANETDSTANAVLTEPASPIAPDAAAETIAPPKAKKAAEKKTADKPPAAPIALPDGKVSVEATVAEFASVPNPFSDTDDEVVIFEQISFQHDGQATALDTAWSSHSMALKKLELQIGDQLSFEAKLVAKKLNKHPVKYKINNAAKITKKDPE